MLPVMREVNQVAWVKDSPLYGSSLLTGMSISGRFGGFSVVPRKGLVRNGFDSCCRLDVNGLWFFVGVDVCICSTNGLSGVAVGHVAWLLFEIVDCRLSLFRSLRRLLCWSARSCRRCCFSWCERSCVRGMYDVDGCWVSWCEKS